MRFDQLPDKDYFAKDSMFDDCTSVADVVRAVLRLSITCFDAPEQIGDYQPDRGQQVVDHATARIAELLPGTPISSTPTTTEE